MAAVKKNLNVRANKLAEDHGTGKTALKKNFKIYRESQNDRSSGCPASDCTRISVPINERTTRTTASHTKNLKGTFQNVGKNQSKRDSSVKVNVKRNVLADVSNTHGSFPRKEVHDGSKPLHGKNEKHISLQWVPAGRAAQGASTSAKKIFMGKLKAKPSEDVGSYEKMKQDTKACLNNQRSTGQGHASANTGRMAVRNRPAETRNSLPVPKRVEKVITSAVKANDTISEKVKGENRFSVKSKLGQKPQVSQSRTLLWRNRSSDGSIAAVSKGQTRADSYAISEKSSRIKPLTKTSVTAANSQRTSKLSDISSSNKLLPVSTTLNRKEGDMTSILSENVTSVAHYEPTQEEDSVEGRDNLCMKLPAAKAKTNSNRRKSFTSFLVSGSKILEKQVEIGKQDELPSIDNSSNHLEVSQYVDDIYQYYWVTEAQNPCLADYMKIQMEITPQMRGILINWLSEVHFKFDLMQETLYLTITLLDRYLSQVVISKNEMQLVGLTALLLASKYEDFWHPRIKDLISISAESYSRDQLLGMEKLVLNKLKFRLNSPTLYVFMLRFLKAAQSDTKLESLAFYLIELCLVEYEALKFKPSLLCASAVYVARHTLQMTPAWTPLLGRHSRYDEHQIRDCAAMILRFHKAAKTGMLHVTYEKYSRPELDCVAELRPLDSI